MLTSCGHDEPDVAVIETCQVAAGEHIENTDVSLDGVGRLVSASGNWVISKCAENVPLQAMDAQDVLMSLNKKMEVSPGTTYAIVETAHTQHFKSGKVAVQCETDVCYVRADELNTDGSMVTAMRCSVVHRPASRGLLPAWGTTRSCQKYDNNAWFLELPVVEAEMMAQGMTFTPNHLSNGTRFKIVSNGAGVQIYYDEKYHNSYYRLDALAYLRQGSVFTKVRLVD